MPIQISDFTHQINFELKFSIPFKKSSKKIVEKTSKKIVEIFDH
jgi:hypothetical protein